MSVFFPDSCTSVVPPTKAIRPHDSVYFCNRYIQQELKTLTLREYSATTENFLFKYKRRPKFVKLRFNWMIFLTLLFDSSLYYKVSGLVIDYLLIISGIETNPGPKDDSHERKRFRKSGVRYKTYLNSSESFEKAPKTLKQEINPVIKDALFEPQQSNTPSSAACVIMGSFIETNSENIYLFNEEPNDLPVFDTDESEETDLNFATDTDLLLSDSSDSDSEPSDENDVEKEVDFEKRLIYKGAQITLGTSMLLTMSFVLNHNLTGEAFSDLLELLQLHCMESNLLPENMGQLKQWFQNLKITPNKHYYCGECLLKITDHCLECPNQKCKKEFNSMKDRCFFIEVSVIKQLEKLFAEEDFRNKLVSFQKRKKTNDDIEEMYDGEHYQHLFMSEFFSEHDISFTWNTDGVPLFKSSKTSMWPLFLTINELPFAIRRNPENLLLVGLWIGPKKPEMLTFLDPFIEDLQTLQDGIEIHAPINDLPMFKLRGYLIAGTADLPAKCTVHNMVQFNGKYSCPHCTQPGETAKAGKGVAHIFPFQYDGATEPKRTHQESLEQAERAFQSGKSECGIKGPCWLTQLQFYDFVKSNCIDYMHCVLLGVTKRLLTLWFSKDNANEPFSFFRHTDEVNRRLAKLKPPLFITRAPRPLSELKYWKASEYKSFLLYYGPVILVDILNNSYYSHFLLLSEGIYILLKQSIKMDELKHAENLLEQFVMTFATLYKARYLTLNFHLLLHFPENVKQLGPIWGYSCFPFEDGNGFLMKLVKGTQHVHSQLIDTMAIVHGLPYLEKNSIEPGSKAEKLLHGMKKNAFRKCMELSENVTALGKVKQLSPEDLSPDGYIALANRLNSPPNGTILKFKRIKLYNKILHSKEYTRVKVRNSYTVSYTNEPTTIEYGIIHYFVHYSADNSDFSETFAIVTPLCDRMSAEYPDRRMPFPINEITGVQQMTHMKLFQLPSDFVQTPKVAILVKNIKFLCISLSSSFDDIVVCCPPNMVEKE